jgi:dTMP kinase
MDTARFITFEGGEGAGKSTVLAAASRTLERLGIRHRMTREPGGTRLGEALRVLLLDPRHAGMCAEAETLMMFAARAQHVVETIRPALFAGEWVISDRYTDASYAYQGGGRGVARTTLEALEHWAAFDLKPDRTYLLDVSVATGRARAAARGMPDRVEAESDAFFERVRGAYRARAAEEPGRFVVIDAGQPLEAVVAAVESDLVAWVTGQGGGA